MRACVSFSLLCAVVSAAVAPPAKPHVILLVADDLGFGDCEFTGMSDVRTPAINALLARGDISPSSYAASLAALG